MSYVAHQYSRVNFYSSLEVNLSLYYGGVVLLGVTWDGIYEMVTHASRSLFLRNNYFHSNICQNLVFWRPFCFTPISQNAQC